MLEVYNYLTTAFHPKQSRVRASAHKELTNVYNHIRNLSSQSPLFKLNLTGQGQIYALNIKDTALSLKYHLEDYSDEERSAFLRQEAHSEEPEIVEVNLLSGSTKDIPDEFYLRVLQLAATQLNQSVPVSANEPAGLNGACQFTVTMEDTPYHFNLKLNQEHTNQEVMEKLTDFIRRSSIGLSPSIVQGNSGELQMLLESETAGDTGNGQLFSLSDANQEEARKGLVSFYELDHMIRAPKNAKFTLNGSQKEALGNTFRLYRNLSVTLKSVSDSTVRIYLRPEAKSIYEDVKETIDTYNRLIDIASSNCGNRRSKKLLHELGNVAKAFQEELSDCGIHLSEGYRLKIDEEKAKESIQNGSMKQLLTKPGGFGTELAVKASLISLNPMDYLDKVIVTYPNLRAPSASNPYLTSMYSGMLFNSYC